MTARLHTVAIDNSHKPAPPIVFLHGFGGAGAQWWGLQMAASFKAPTLAFDLPGHGQSMAYPDAGPPKVAAKAVLAELGQRGHDRVHLIGHSMGGAVASLIALIDPDRVASLTLLAPGGFGPDVNVDVLHDWAAADTAEALATVLPQFFHPGFALPDKMIEFQLELRQRHGAVAALQALAAVMFRENRQGVLPLDDLLSHPRPHSVIWGKDDAIIPVSQAEQLQGRTDLHLLENVGHSPLEEASNLVREVLWANVAAGNQAQR